MYIGVLTIIISSLPPFPPSLPPSLLLPPSLWCTGSGTAPFTLQSLSEYIESHKRKRAAQLQSQGQDASGDDSVLSIPLVAVPTSFATTDSSGRIRLTTPIEAGSKDITPVVCIVPKGGGPGKIKIVKEGEEEGEGLRVEALSSISHFPHKGKQRLKEGSTQTMDAVLSNGATITTRPLSGGLRLAQYTLEDLPENASSPPGDRQRSTTVATSQGAEEKKQDQPLETVAATSGSQEDRHDAAATSGDILPSPPATKGGGGSGPGSEPREGLVSSATRGSAVQVAGSGAGRKEEQEPVSSLMSTLMELKMLQKRIQGTEEYLRIAERGRGGHSFAPSHLSSVGGVCVCMHACLWGGCGASEDVFMIKEGGRRY